MDGDYLIVDKKILPSYYEKVVAARRLLETGQQTQVSAAVRQVGISRNTYYKYKDYVFAPNGELPGRRAVISMLLSHRVGMLSSVLNALSALGTSVITITQSPPIAERASVTITLDIARISCPLNEALKILEALDGVEKLRLVAVE